MFQRLRWLAATRGTLRDVRRLMQVDVDTGAASFCTPLVRQVLTKILLQVREGKGPRVEDHFKYVASGWYNQQHG